MKPTTAFLRELCVDTRTSWAMWSSHLMVSLLSLDPGTAPCVCGTSLRKWNEFYQQHHKSKLNVSLTFWPLRMFFSGTTTRRFVGHTKDVLSVAFSADNRQIVSGSRDKTIKLWNTLGVCKYTIQVRAPPTHGCHDGVLCHFHVSVLCCSSGWKSLWVGFLCPFLPKQQ